MLRARNQESAPHALVEEEGDPPERVAHRDEVKSAFLAESFLGPLRQDEVRRVLEKALHVLPTSRREALSRDFEERAAEIEDIDSVELLDGEVLRLRNRGSARLVSAT